MRPVRVTRRDLLRGGLVAGSLLLVPGPAGRAAAAPLPSLRPGGPPRVGPWRVLAGSLHDHSTDSDGDSASEAIQTWLYAHREELGVDFATLSDHSDFFPLSPARSAAGGTPGEPDLWHRQAALAARFQGSDYSFLRGFEWTNDQENHLNVLLSQNWTSRAITGDAALRMPAFWEWFDADPLSDSNGSGASFGGGDGVGLFNHPGDKGVLNWDDYALDAAAARRMALIEIHGSQGKTGRGDSDAGWYWFALSRGWTVSPVMNWDWHTWSGDGVLTAAQPGADYGVAGHLPGQRSLVLATDSTPASIRSALLARRTTATEIPDLWASLRGPGGEWQGSLVTADGGAPMRVTVDAGSPTEALHHVEIVSDNGRTGDDYYLGDNPDWMAPHAQLTASYVAQHARYTATGRATRKQLAGGGRYDGPPPGTVVASAPLSGTRDTVTLDVPPPSGPSPRPDGLHFFYAVVYAGSAAAPGYARAWTGPLLSQDVAAALPETPAPVVLPVLGLAAGAAAWAVHHRHRATLES